MEVDDLDAAVDELSARGVRISAPVEATPGVRTAFVTMAATHGLRPAARNGRATADDPPAQPARRLTGPGRRRGAPRSAAIAR